MDMDGIDVHWCDHCEIKTVSPPRPPTPRPRRSPRTQNGEMYCSERCREANELKLRAQATPAPNDHFDFGDMSVVDLAYEEDLTPLQDDFFEEKADTPSLVKRWLASVPYGAPPGGSVASSPIDESPLATTPSQLRDATPSPRTSFSAASSRSQRSRRGTFTQPIASSSTLRPSLPASLSARKPAPPRLSYLAEGHSSPQHSPTHSSVCSPHTVTALPHACTSTSTLPHAACASTYANAGSSIGRVSPTHTLPILTPQISLPSLTTQSATASLSSLATPHTSSRPPSHPASRAASVKNYKYFDDCASEADSMSSFSRATRVKTRFTNIASALSSKFCNWAASNSIQPPYSSAHVLPREGASRASSQAHRSKIDEASPAPRAAPSPASRTPAPSMPVDRPLPTQRPPSPVSMYPVQDGFVRPASDFERSMKEKQQGRAHVKRMGRGLVPARVQSRMDLAGIVQQPQREDHPAFRNRGRKVERLLSGLGEPVQ